MRLDETLTLSSTDRSPRWRLYRSKKDQRIFLRVETHEVAGGGFRLDPGISHGKFPSGRDIPYAQTDALVKERGFFYYGKGSMIGLVAHCQLNLELNWQAPSKKLVLQALATDEGRELLEGLGVTADEKHHMLSFGIVESLGVDIPDEEFDPVVAKFIPLLDHAINTKIAPALADLGYSKTGTEVTRP